MSLLTFSALVKILKFPVTALPLWLRLSFSASLPEPGENLIVPISMSTLPQRWTTTHPLFLSIGG